MSTPLEKAASEAPVESGTAQALAARWPLFRSRLGRSTGAPRTARAHLVLAALLAVAVFGSVLAVGAVHTPVLVVIAADVFVAVAIAFGLGTERQQALPISLPAVIALVLAAFTLLQAMPIPLSWLGRIAPPNADVWARALLPLGQAPPAWASVSLDPGATLVEALKWLVYAGVFAAAQIVASRRGAGFGAAIVFLSALAAALTTIGHGLLGATKVFGIYEPQFAVTAWHVGPLLNPNSLSGYINLGVLSGIGLLLMRRPLVPRWLIGLGVATLIGVNVTSGSRGGVFALVVGVAGLAVLLRLGKRSAGHDAPLSSRSATALFCAALGAGALLALLGATRSTWAELYQKDFQKLEMILWVKPLVGDYTWLGIGRGAFESVFPAYRVVPGNIVFTHAESFPAQWLSEWGLPAAALGMGAFAYAFTPTRMGALRSAVAAGGWTGAAALVLQNLFDLGLELPSVSIALAALLGSLWGDSRRRDVQRTRAVRLSPERARRLALLLLAVGAIVIAAVLRFGWHDVAGDRAMIRAQVEKTTLRDPSASAPIRSMLRDAMQRHPAEPYFPFIGALVAFRSGTESPIPWLQRSLERAQVNGKAHLLLSEVLARKGALRQALFELRLAVETDFALTDYAARLAVRWAKDYDEILLAVPDGQKGAVMLDTLGVVAAGTPLGARCDREAIARDSTIVGPHEREANALIAALSATQQKSPAEGSASVGGANLCANRELCKEEIEAHAAKVAAALPRASNAVQIRARALIADGRAADAERLLSTACPTVTDREPCLLARLSTAFSTGRTDRVDVAAKELLGASCATATACADMATRIADMRASQGELGAALVLYARAAREDPVESRWLRLADAASRSGAHAQAAAALEKVAHKRGGADAALKQRIEDERARAMGDLLPK